MPAVDFSLEDVGQLMGALLVEERDYTRAMVREEVRTEVRREVTEQFMLFIEHTFDPAISSLQDQITTLDGRMDAVEADIRDIKGEVTGTRRVVNQHSKDIMELRARAA